MRPETEDEGTETTSSETIHHRHSRRQPNSMGEPMIYRVVTNMLTSVKKFDSSLEKDGITRTTKALPWLKNFESTLLLHFSCANRMEDIPFKRTW